MNGQMRLASPEGGGRKHVNWAPDAPCAEIDFGDPRFPRALKGIPRPPKRLHVVGSPDALSEGIAVIGARKATPYGTGCARRFASLAASHGITVVSGGAYGCDSHAHRAALDSGGLTVVFFGGGCNRPYPARNIDLFRRVVGAGGAVVSEQDWDVPPLPWMFRERNRLIAGLSKATLVVEAGLPSGTFSTADEALAANKDVLAVPGSITSPTSAGSNRLIAQGAVPIVDDESFESALFLLFGTMANARAEREKEVVDPLLAALMANPLRVDEIASLGLVEGSSTMDAMSRTMARLAELEARGLVARFPDGRYGPAHV